MHVVDAVLAFVVAMALAVALTPLAKRLAIRAGAMAKPNERGLAQTPTPQWGGLAILVAVLVAAAIWLPATINLPHTAHGPRGAGGTVHTWTILLGALVITLVGAIDDYHELHPLLKLAGQVAAAVIVVEGG